MLAHLSTKKIYNEQLTLEKVGFVACFTQCMSNQVKLRTKSYAEHSQTSKIDDFSKIVIDKKRLDILVKSFDVRLSSEYVSGKLYYQTVLRILIVMAKSVFTRGTKCYQSD